MNSDHICVKYKSKVCLFLLDVAVHVSAVLASVLVKALFNLSYISRLLSKLSIPELCSQCVWHAAAFVPGVQLHFILLNCTSLVVFLPDNADCSVISIICQSPSLCFYLQILSVYFIHTSHSLSPSPSPSLSCLSSLHPNCIRLMPELCETH